MTSEQQLVALLESCGFDCTATAREIAIRFPKELDWSVPSNIVLPVRLTQPFAGFGPIWKMPLSREIDFALPTMYFHEFHLTNHVRSNFDRAVEQLTAVLSQVAMRRVVGCRSQSSRLPCTAGANSHRNSHTPQPRSI